MATLLSQAQALIDYANGVTGKSDTTLGDAVKSLADNYGGTSDSEFPTIADYTLLSSQVQALIAYANSIDGQSDTKLGDAMRHLAEGGSVLPSGYTECEYLQSSGKQYIDTGLYGNLDTEVYCEAAIVSEPSSNRMFFGSTKSDNVLSLALYYQTNGYIRLQYDSTTRTILNDISYAINTYNTIYIGNKQMIIDDVISQTFANATEFTTPYTLILFSGKYGAHSISELAGAFRVKSFKIVSASVDALNFIPCLDTDGTPCMYDTVSKQPFYNQGSGTFGYKTKAGVVVDPT